MISAVIFLLLLDTLSITFVPRKNINRKNVSKLRPIAELGSFDGIINLNSLLFCFRHVFISDWIWVRSTCQRTKISTSKMSFMSELYNLFDVLNLSYGASFMV